jgi:chromosome segregation ATPase
MVCMVYGSIGSKRSAIVTRWRERTAQLALLERSIDSRSSELERASQRYQATSARNITLKHQQQSIAAKVREVAFGTLLYSSINSPFPLPFLTSNWFVSMIGF